jgi:hypothetical protein
VLFAFFESKLKSRLSHCLICFWWRSGQLDLLLSYQPTTNTLPLLTLGASLKSLLSCVGRGAATDYPGLRTPEVHPYLVGISEGRAALDSVRAAQRVPGANQAIDAGHGDFERDARFGGAAAPSSTRVRSNTLMPLSRPVGTLIASSSGLGWVELSWFSLVGCMTSSPA